MLYYWFARLNQSLLDFFNFAADLQFIFVLLYDSLNLVVSGDLLWAVAQLFDYALYKPPIDIDIETTIAQESRELCTAAAAMCCPCCTCWKTQLSSTMCLLIFDTCWDCKIPVILSIDFQSRLNKEQLPFFEIMTDLVNVKHASNSWETAVLPACCVWFTEWSFSK